MADLYREQRKQELRARIIDTGKLKQEEEAQKQDLAKKRRIRITIVLALVLLAASVASFFLARREYHGYSTRWRIDFLQEGSSPDADYEAYFPYAEGLVKVTRDGANYLNADGRTVWNQSFEMNDPFVSINGDYCAIADQGKNTIYIMGKEGTTGEAETVLPITKVAVSRRGVVYAILEDSNASYITVFSREGAALDISIKSVLSGDGYPIDISVSPDGTELMASFVYLESGLLKNKLVFYNLSELGQNAGQNRVVGGFTEDFQGVMAGRVHFSDDTYAQAFYDGGIAFFSTKVLTSPELLVKAEIPETIRSIAYAESYVGVVTDNPNAQEDGDPYRMLVYRSNGQLLFARSFAFQYDGFVLDQKRILFYRGNELEVYDMGGRLRYHGVLDVPVSCARIASSFSGPFSLHVLLGSEGLMESIKLS